MAIVTHLSATQQATVLEEITDQAIPHASFLALVLLSTAIASFGLLANSTAVVIGAMLIAPLMGPIFGIAVALIRQDRHLFVEAARSEAAGIGLAIGLAVAIGWLPLRPEFGTEILARTTPNLYDLLVAVVAGLAAGYARVDARVSPTLPGVAIATALVPPLAVCGLCLSDARWPAAGGAFLLFAANLLAIEISAGAIFVMAGLGDKPARERSLGGWVRRFAVPISLLLPISLFLVYTLIVLVRADRLTNRLRAVLNEDLRAIVGAEVTEVQHHRRGSALDVVAIVLTPQSIEPPVVSATEADLRRRVDPLAHLIVRSLISRDADGSGQVFLDRTLKERLRDEDRQRSFLSAVSAALDKSLTAVPGAELVDVKRETPDSRRVTATVRAASVIGPDQVAVMERVLSEGTRATVELSVRSIVTVEADARAYLNESAESVLRRRVREALITSLASYAPEAELLSARTVAGDTAIVTATILDFPARDRRLLEQLSSDLSRAAKQPARLVVRTVRAIDAGSRDADAARRR